MNDQTHSTSRLGLLAKLNLLSIGGILITALGVTGFLVQQEARDAQTKLESQARTTLEVLAEVSEYTAYTANKDDAAQILDILKFDADIAYAEMLGARRESIAARGFQQSELPPLSERSGRIEGETVIAEIRHEGRRMLELITPIRTRAANQALRGIGAGAESSAPIGFIRLGMHYERVAARQWTYIFGAIKIATGAILLSVLIVVLLTRRMVMPINRLTRAARAVAAGRFDVHVPVTTRDELAELTEAFNDMAGKLATSRSEIVSYQRRLEENKAMLEHNQHTLEEQVTLRTQELKVATANAYRLAQHDILTGLPNRALLNTRLKQMLAEAERQQQEVAVLFIDFDHFKRINDTLGHDAGDQLLRDAAQRLQQALREMDTVARLGGDEFLIVVPGLQPAHSTHYVMELLARVQRAFATPFTLAGQDLTVTVSIGIALYPEDANDPVGLVKQADTAMYAAKEHGRDAYRFYTPEMNTRVQARLKLENDLRRALANNEFELVYQPQIDISSGWPVGVEALLRWRDPERGLISPGEFIPVAEESGLIHPMGTWALRTACLQARSWHDHDLPMRLSVNLSVQQLEQENWVSVVEHALADSGLLPRFLDLEITESVIISNPEKAVATLMRLKSMGVTITMDDFGTGYSSLNYLTRLPLHSVKIDQKFVRGLDHDHNDEAITLAILALAKGLGLRVIAEGVESPAQYRFLQRHGCEEAQGFYISAPLDSGSLFEWWRNRLEMAAAVHPERPLV
ncbi:MAG: EAL domain-containing protein [Betaproteobacteria bacterium]|nr:EAL domain-containing protein [Betaproteobacteria bacterium]